MVTQKHKRKSVSVIRVFCTLISIILVLSLFSMIFNNTVSATRVFPPSSCCEGGDCCILSDCICPNCEDREEPGSVCSKCGGDLCANCGNCYDCGTNPCPLCREYCFNCGSFNLCMTCFGCLDCGHNRDPECPDCGEELLLIEAVESDDFPELIVEDNLMPVHSSSGIDFFLFAPFGMPAWSILNLVLTLAGIVFSIVIIIRAARLKEIESIEFNERTSELQSVISLENIKLLSALENEESFMKKRRLWGILMTCFLSLSALLLLILIQDFSGAIVLVDWWIIFHSLLFVFTVICGKLAFKKYETSDNHLYVPSSP